MTEHVVACPVALAKPQPAANPPSHKLYRVVKGRNGGRDIWTEIAVCWPHKDGNGFNVKMASNETLAPGGDYVIRRNTPKAPK